MSYDHELYMHDLDRKVTAALNTFPRMTDLVEAYHANFDERKVKVDMLSKAVRLSENQMPKIYELLPPICDRLEIEVPELYYIRGKEMNAYSYGSVSPVILVTSSLADQLPPEMIKCVLAHECGHIACRHTLFHSMAESLLNTVNKELWKIDRVIYRYLTPALQKALLFWDRCSEFSADRAAVLCDGDAENTVDMLLRVHGYGRNVNRDEFIKQAIDLEKLTNDSKSNKLFEWMLTSDEDHPRLATRVYECYSWSKTEQFKGILDGTYTISQKKREREVSSEEEVITGEVGISTGKSADNAHLDEINTSLSEVNSKLERYTNSADKTDYALAVGSGILSGLIDSIFVGEFSLLEAEQWGTEKVNSFVLSVAKKKGYKGDDLRQAITKLEEAYPIAADKMTKKLGGGKQHHLRDFSHHPTPIGLICSILTQFTKKVYGTDVDGNFVSLPLNEEGLNLIGKNFYERITLGVVNWIFHMASDMAGSSSSVSKGSLGTGLPGPLLSLLKELSSTPLFRKMNGDGHKQFSVFISKLFNGTLLGERDENGKVIIQHRFDLRMEVGVAHHLGRETVPVIINECVIRAIFFVRRLTMEIMRVQPDKIEDLSKLNWQGILPFKNRTLDRMIAVSSITFSVADTADATIHAAIESGGNWVLFSGRFITRFNYIGAGRAALAVVKEVSNERKETQLIHEKMLLSEEKASIFLAQLQDFKAKLEERVSNYLAEDITEFMSGFDYMNKGLAEGDSDLVIRGNVIIQKVLGREPQFTNQEEFDELMESEEPLRL